MSPYYDEMRQQVLDSAGNRSWHCGDQDPDDFFSKVVVPLREMKARGAFDGLAEAKENRRGNSVVVRVDIIGPINHGAL